MFNHQPLASVQTVWDKKGYYLVNGQKYYSKLQAIVAGRDQHFPQFVFNDHHYDLADWSTEPTESLLEIYKQRALQLRQKYDHLVLCYSSGADSTNILHAFIYNNIPIDEIFCYGPFDTTQGQNGKPRDNSAEYNYREIDLVAIPYLRELAKTHNFKVTFHSWAQDMILGYKNADWVWTEVNCRLSPSIIARNRLQKGAAHLNLINKGKKVGFIYGVDKPRVILKNNQYYLAFLDLVLQQSVGLGAVITESDWENDEFFYWTPDMPKIVVKQAHVIKQFFENHPALKPYVADADRADWNQNYGEKYLDVVKRLIYPTFNPNTWQTKKNSSMTFAENDSWFFANSDETAKKNWYAGVQQVEKTVDSKWFNQGDISHGFVGSWSKWYKIG